MIDHFIKMKLCYFTDFIYPVTTLECESCRWHANCKAYPIVGWVPKLLRWTCSSVLLPTIQDRWQIYFEPELIPTCEHIDNRAMSTNSCWLCFISCQPANLGTQLIPIAADELSLLAVPTRTLLTNILLGYQVSLLISLSSYSYYVMIPIFTFSLKPILPFLPHSYHILTSDSFSDFFAMVT